MSFEIREVGIESLTVYARIPIAFRVDSVFRIQAVDQGLGGLTMIEEDVAPYVKSYDSVVEGERGPVDWPKRFDVSRWAFFLALDGDHPVGGAAVAFGTPDVNMLEGREDLAVLWDIRVHPDYRRRGIGTSLFKRAADWARQKGCNQLKVETQNVNVAACRFYARQGCELGAIHRYGYVGCAPVAHEAMLLWYLEL